MLLRIDDYYGKEVYMLIRIDDSYGKMLKEIAEFKGGDVAFNDIIETAIKVMYDSMVSEKLRRIISLEKLIKESYKNG